MKLVRFSYENGELADHEICAIDFPLKWKISEKGRVRLYGRRGQVQRTVSPDKRAEDGRRRQAGLYRHRTSVIYRRIGSGRADSTVKNLMRKK